jgi:hypothetical protein
LLLTCGKTTQHAPRQSQACSYAPRQPKFPNEPAGLQRYKTPSHLNLPEV